MKLKMLAGDEQGSNNKKKSIDIKVTIVKDMDSEDEDSQSKSDENMKFMFKKFKEFLRHEKHTLEFQMQQDDSHLKL